MYFFTYNGFKRFWLSFKCLLLIHFLALIFMTLFRVALYFSFDNPPASVVNAESPSVIPAFIRGLWFDNVIGCYILILPLTAVFLCSLFNYYGKILWRSILVFFSVFYFIAFLITTANIPYFNYFFKIINSSIYNWFGYVNTTAGMIFGEVSYYPPILGFFAVSIFFIVAISRLIRHFQQQQQTLPYPRFFPDRIYILVFGLLSIGLCLFGIRGRTGYNPIKISAAYYCTDPFFNQLGINPVFNLLNSTLDDNRKENRYLNLMPEQEALQKVKQYLNWDVVPVDSVPSKPDFRPNIVMVFMESMSAQLMQRFGQEKTLTPFLDSLYKQSIGFPNFYSSGIHTNHGLYSTLYSYPAIMKRNAMKGSVIPTYPGLSTVLKSHGYQTLFFMTHESQYDNMNAFFRTNGYDEIFSQENYPTEKVVNGFGVQDDFLYQYAIERLNEKASPEKPFFATLLSVSNHPPYIIPDYFHPQNEHKEDQIVEYADWSLRRFMENAAQQKWYDNTVFVFLGDHGKMVGNTDCEMPQAYNHIPFMIYTPQDYPHKDRFFAREESGFGGQIDVAPTLLGLLDISYYPNSFGVDLLKTKRPCIYFTADNMIGVRNDSCQYIFVPENDQEFRYLITNNNYQPTTNSPVFDSLKNYAFSMLQAAELITRQKKIN